MLRKPWANARRLIESLAARLLATRAAFGSLDLLHDPFALPQVMLHLVARLLKHVLQFAGGPLRQHIQGRPFLDVGGSQHPHQCRIEGGAAPCLLQLPNRDLRRFLGDLLMPLGHLGAVASVAEIEQSWLRVDRFLDSLNHVQSPIERALGSLGKLLENTVTAVRKLRWVIALRVLRRCSEATIIGAATLIRPAIRIVPALLPAIAQSPLPFTPPLGLAPVGIVSTLGPGQSVIATLCRSLSKTFAAVAVDRLL